MAAYTKFIQDAKAKDVDILVFPEATLNYGNYSDRASLINMSVVIPDIINGTSLNPTSFQGSDVLRNLSAKVREAQIYVLVNILEKVPCESGDDCHDKFILYNTNIVFNRNGTIISKYRKFNLYLEKEISTTTKAVQATFVTDFGVHFGHFICFDILFHYPAKKMVDKNVRHFLFPNMWFAEEPFLTGAQTQAAWAYANNVNLLAAGANMAATGTSGSGIYVGRQGAAKIIMSPDDTSQLLVARVPKNPDHGDIHEDIQSNRFSQEKMMTFHTNTYDVSKLGKLYDLNSPKYSDEICHEKFCCKILVETTAAPKVTTFMFCFEGPKPYRDLDRPHRISLKT